MPVLEVFKRQPKQVALTALLRLPEQAPGYIFGAFIFTYGTTVLGASRNFLLIARARLSRLAFLWVTVAGHLSDRIGRKRMYMIGCVFVADVRLHLLCPARYQSARVDVSRHRRVAVRS